MKDKYYILLNRKNLIEVTEEIWQVYYRMRAKERYMLKVYRKKCISLETQFYEGSYYSTMAKLTKSPEDIIVNKLTNVKLHLAINALPNIEKIVIYKYFFLDYTEAEIGRYLGISQQAVNLRKKNALKRLKDILII